MATSEAKIYNGGTSLLFNGVAGTADVNFSMEGLLDGEVQVSDQHDLGAPPRYGLFAWHCEMYMQATPDQYTSIDFFAAGCPDDFNTLVWGDLGVSDNTYAAQSYRLRNLMPIGSVVVDTNDTTVMRGGRTFVWPHRYISIVGFNNASSGINATDSNFKFYLMPYSWQGQAT